MKINKEELLCAMVRANMTNQKLAVAAGISISQVSNIRRGKGSTYETACKLAKALNTSVEELIENEDENTDSLEAMVFEMRNVMCHEIIVIESMLYKIMDEMGIEIRNGELG